MLKPHGTAFLFVLSVNVESGPKRGFSRFIFHFKSISFFKLLLFIFADEEIDVVSVDKPKPQLKRKLSEPNNKQSPKTSNKRILKRATSLPVTANSRSLKRVFDDSSSDASSKCFSPFDSL